MSKWKSISETKLSETLNIVEFERLGFWLWDETRGMNLAMRAKTRDEAFTDALTYYQKRLSELEKEHSELQKKVKNFVSQFVSTESDESDDLTNKKTLLY